MTVIDALPRAPVDVNGEIEERILIPVAAVDEEGNEYPGYTTEDWVRAAFGALVEAEVPLSTEAYQALLDASTPNWKRNWEHFRTHGVI